MARSTWGPVLGVGRSQVRVAGRSPARGAQLGLCSCRIRARPRLLLVLRALRPAVMSESMRNGRLCRRAGAYAVLNDFVAPESPGVTVRRPFRSHQTVKDVLEAMGITHTKVDLIVVNGDAVGFPTGRPLATVLPHTRCSSVRHRVHGPAVAGAAASSPLRRRCLPLSVGAAASGWTCGRRVTPTTRTLPMSACHGRTQLPAPQAPAAPPADSRRSAR